MKIIDLSKTLEHGMKVYPGDPEVRITQAHTLEKEGWMLKELHLGSHTGTHVDVPAHMHHEGMSLDHLPIDRFFGKAIVVSSAATPFRKHIGLIFREGSIDLPLFERILEAEPPFIATGNDAHLTIEMERKLLERNILTFTDLINLSALPADQEVTFFGVPLKIKNGDGSPVRAFAVVE